MPSSMWTIDETGEQALNVIPGLVGRDYMSSCSFSI